MCEQTTCLAGIDSFQQITYGEDKLFHVRWHGTVLHLPCHEFMRVVRVLEEAMMEVNLHSVSDARLCGLWQLPNGDYKLWVKQAVLFVTLDDFFSLTNLMRLAARRFRALQHHRGEYQQYQVRVVAGDLFSAT